MEFADKAAASRKELNDGTVITRCDECRTMYAERTPPAITPCYESCGVVFGTDRVELRDENADVLAIYLTTRRQYVTADMGQVVDISIPAIKDAMDLYPYPIRNKWRCLKRVQKVFHHFEAIRQEKAKEDAGG